MNRPLRSAKWFAREGKRGFVPRVAFDKVNGERHSMRELEEGACLRDVYARYGVL